MGNTVSPATTVLGKGRERLWGDGSVIGRQHKEAIKIWMWGCRVWRGVPLKLRGRTAGDVFA